MTRDSIVWKVLVAIGLTIGTLSTIADPAAYGIQPDWMPWIRLAALFIGTLGGVLGNSPLPGAGKTKVPGAGAGVLIVVLTTAALTSTGCAGLLASKPGEAQQTAKLAELYQAARIVQQAGLIVEQAQILEIRAHDLNTIPDATHQIVRQAFGKTARAVQAGLDAARDVTRPPAARQEAITAAIDAITTLADDPAFLSLPTDTRTAVVATLRAAKLAVAVIPLFVDR